MTTATTTLKKAPTSSNGISLADVGRDAKPEPDRIVIHGGGTAGKTSLAARFPNPIFLMSRGEDGARKLKSAGMVPENVAYVPANGTLDDWDAMLSWLRVLATETHDYQTIVIDTASGVERMLYAKVCKDQFNGDWGEKGFASYGVGVRTSAPIWQAEFLYKALDFLRLNRGMTIILLAHTEVKNFKNPEGPDYDRYQPEMDAKLWNPTFAWADFCFFVNFRSEVYKDRGDKKLTAHGGAQRYLYTQRTAAYDAKSRFPMPAEIDLGDDADEGYKRLATALAASKKQGVK